MEIVWTDSNKVVIHCEAVEYSQLTCYVTALLALGHKLPMLSDIHEMMVDGMDKRQITKQKERKS